MRRARSISTWCRCSRWTRGTSARTGCERISCNCSTICIPDSCAFPAAASSKAANWSLAIAGRRRWAISPNAGPSSTAGTIEFDQRPAPDYFQSFGLGFYEYFQLAEDVGAGPLPILNCGMACQFKPSETAEMDQLDEYVRDALDLIEFAKGPATSPWGKLRAQMGHSEPFHLEMIGVGNEQWGPRYVERYKMFAAAFKAKHPEIRLVVAAGPAPAGEPFDSMWANWRRLHPDIVDEHYYMSPEWFLSNTGRYDHYDRSGPKVFAGEYAAQTSGKARRIIATTGKAPSRKRPS